MKAKNYALACPKFAESQRLDPSASTAFNLARCYQVTKRLASAWASFRQAASIARSQNNDRVVKIATKAAEALTPQLTKLIIVVPATHRVANQKVFLDGSAMNESMWGSAIPVDSGKHIIEARAPGYQTWSRTMAVPHLPTVVTINIPQLAKRPLPPAPPNGPATVAATTLSSQHAKPDQSGNGRQTAGYVVAGIGATALAVGIGVGIHALVQNAASNDHCGAAIGNDDADACFPKGVDLRTQAQSAGGAAIGLLIAGGVVAGVGLTLYLTAPKRAASGHAAPTDQRARRASRASLLALGVRASPAGVSLHARW